MAGCCCLISFIYFLGLFLGMCMFTMYSTAWFVYYVYDIAWMEGLCYEFMYAIIAVAIIA